VRLQTTDYIAVPFTLGTGDCILLLDLAFLVVVDVEHLAPSADVGCAPFLVLLFDGGHGDECAGECRC